MQVAFNNDLNFGVPPTAKNMLCGNTMVGDLYIERIPIDKLDVSSDEAVQRFLYRVYRMKVNRLS